MKKGRFYDFTKSIVIQMIIQSIMLIGTAYASNLIMTWIVEGLAQVQDTYLAATYEAVGTLIITGAVLVPINTAAYNRRRQDITTLSDYIRKVADGNYGIRIPILKKDQMTPVYEDFNKMCAELESVQILKNDFINSYSHEFKTPIASINGFSSLLLEEECTQEEATEYLRIIRDESERLSNLAKNTILLSKISSQQVMTNMENYNLGEQLRQCAIILSSEWMKKKISFSGEFPDTTYYGNKELMQHLWLNIMGNAVKYTPDGGEIMAELTKNKESVTITVKDTGEGMDKDTVNHMFEPYYQGDTSHSSKGLGLGMAIAKRIVELCEGTISVESEIGAGSQFIIELPYKDVTAY